MGTSLMPQQPSTQSFQPRRMAGQRPPQVAGDPQKPQFQTSHPPTQPQGNAQTFAQMQQSGQARPNPMQAQGGYTSSSGDRPMADQAPVQNPVGNPNVQWVQDPITGAYVKAGQQYQQQPDGSYRDGHGTPLDPAGTTHTYYFDQRGQTGPRETMQRPGGPVTGSGVGQMPQPGEWGGTPMPSTSGGYTSSSGDSAAPGTSGGFQMPTYTPYTSGINSQLQDAITQSLSNPSRYDDATFQKLRDASIGSLKQQFGADQQALDEQMARRGLGASTIGSQYQTDLKGQQANALAGLDASLLKDAAGTWAQDRSSALNSGLNFAQMGMQGDQFSKSLAQQLGIAQMGDRTQNRQVDAQSALANNDLMLRVLAALGLPGGMPTQGATASNNGRAGDPPGTIRDAQGNVVRWGTGQTSPKPEKEDGF